MEIEPMSNENDGIARIAPDEFTQTRWYRSITFFVSSMGHFQEPMIWMKCDQKRKVIRCSVSGMSLYFGQFPEGNRRENIATKRNGEENGPGNHFYSIN
jgi:hypothetical protein